MNIRFAPCLAAVAALVLVGPAPGSRAQDPKPQPPASFRAGVTAVPIEVRVTDKNGRPITDLKKEDFTILEDGVPQPIAHFSPQVLAALAPRPGLRARADALAVGASPQTQRIFLLVLGTRALGDVGSHPETLNALVTFVNGRLLPQDQVAVLVPARAAGSVNRATDFTADHRKIVRFLETFRPRATVARSGPPPDPPAASGGSVFAEPGEPDTSPAVRSDVGFEDFVKAWGRKPLGDEIDALLYAIKYLRYMPGEKHLVFVTERGPSPTWDRAKYLISVANDARVALDTIQVGDWVSGWNVPRAFGDGPSGNVPTAEQAGGGGQSAARPDARPSHPVSTADQRSSTEANPGSPPSAILAALRANGVLYDLRYIAAQTGGQATLLKNADVALGRIDVATRVSYLLAYYPSGAWNGRFRSVKVVVNRPGATAYFRHGYYARQDTDVFDRRRILSDSRIASAGGQLGDVRELDVTLVPAFEKAAAGNGGEVVVALSLDIANMAWAVDADGMHTAHLEVAIYCGDARDTVVGEARRLLNLTLTEDTYQRVLKERFARDMRVAVRARPSFVKVVVYDYDADRVGSAFAPLSK